MPKSVRGPASSVVEVGEGAPVAGTPARARRRAGGAQTLAPAKVIRACTQTGEVEGIGPRQCDGRAGGAARLIWQTLAAPTAYEKATVGERWTEVQLGVEEVKEGGCRHGDGSLPTSKRKKVPRT